MKQRPLLSVSHLALLAPDSVEQPIDHREAGTERKNLHGVGEVWPSNTLAWLTQQNYPLLTPLPSGPHLVPDSVKDLPLVHQTLGHRRGLRKNLINLCLEGVWRNGKCCQDNDVNKNALLNKV